MKKVLLLIIIVLITVCQSKTLKAQCIPVSITTQPSNQNDSVPGHAHFNITVAGTAPYNYYWYVNGTLTDSTISSVSATNTYNTPSLSMADSNNTYFCVVTNCGGANTVTCNTAHLVCIPVSISIQPLSQTFTAGNNDTISFSVTVNGTPPFSYYWYGPGGTLVKTTIDTVGHRSIYSFYAHPVVYGMNGNAYHVVISNHCGGLGNSLVSGNAIITVLCPVMAAPPIYGPNNICGGLPGFFNYSTLAVSGALYSWLGAGAPSSLQSPQYLFSAGYCNTNLPLFLTITVNGCTSPSSYLSIYISDPAYISNPPSNQTICSGGNVSYNPIEGGCSTSIIYSHSATSCITGFSGNGYFNINDVLINTSAIPCTVTYSINDLGCYSSAYSFNVTVNPVPQVIVTSPTICAGDTASITTNGAATYTWSTGATATGVNTAIASPPTTSTYTVTGTNTYGCHNTAVSTVTVLNTLNTAVTQTADTLISSQSGATYQWYNCAINGLQPIIGATNQTYVPPANGQYAVAVSLGSCADTSACQLFYSVGVPSIKNNQSTITIYPNPNNGNFMVNYNLVGAEKAFFTIYEVSGRQVMQQTLNPENKIGVINAEDLSAGVYYYEFVINGGETKTNKLIIIK